MELSFNVKLPVTKTTVVATKYDRIYRFLKTSFYSHFYNQYCVESWWR